MRCTFGSCKHDHDLWIKPQPDSGVVPICRGCAESESETYHLSHGHSRDPDRVENYVLAYDPDTALAEQLIDAVEQIEHALRQYEGDNQRVVQKLADTKEQLNTAVGRL